MAPDTAESAKVKPATIDEKTEVRQSTEQMGTNKVEGEKKIGLAEETKQVDAKPAEPAKWLIEFKKYIFVKKV